MKDYNPGQYQVSRVDEWKAYADSPRYTLILLHVGLTFLDLGSSAVIDELHAHVLLTTAELGGVDGDEHCLDPSFLGVLHVSLGDLPVTVHIPGKHIH